MKRKLSRLLVLIVLLTAHAVCMAQQTTVSHIVDRGETLASIAARYHVTEAQIIELNPQAGQFIYVGMELTIPASSTNPQDYSGNTSAQNPTPYEQSPAPSYEEDSSWEPLFSGSYGFLKGENGEIEGYRAKSSAFTMGFTFGAAYKLYRGENFTPYLGAMIGYRATHHNSQVRQGTNYLTDIKDYHFISIPVELGCKIGNKIGLTPVVGFDFDICVAAKGEMKTRTEKEKYKPEKKFAIEFKAGARVNLYGFDIGAFYYVPLGDDTKAAFQDKGYPEVSIGWSF